jgi:hypothetical protein
MKKQYKSLVMLTILMLSTQLLTAQRSGKMLVIARLSPAIGSQQLSAKGLATIVIDGNDVTINGVFDSLSGLVIGCTFYKGTVSSGVDFKDLLPNVRGNRLYTKTTLTDAQITSILRDSVFLIVKTAANPAGELRTQLRLESDILYKTFAQGTNEIPSVATTASALGSFVITKASRSSNNTIDYKIVANGLSGAITAAQLNYGGAGINGRLAYELNVEGNAMVGTLFTNLLILDSFKRGLIYLNIQTVANPAGEIRGQITPITQSIGFDGLIEGAQEVPAVTTSAKGLVYAYIRPTLDTLDYAVQINGLTPTSAHFHSAAAGKTGSVVTNLTSTNFPNFYEGKLGLTPALIKALVRDSFYANFHTTANPSGEIRGQVLSVLRTGLVSNLCGGQETPAVVTNASGVGYVSIHRTKIDAFVEVQTNSLSGNTNAVRIHSGAKGVSGNSLINLSSVIYANGVAGILFNSTNIDTILKGSTYYNIYTAANSTGEIRGQIGTDLVQECLANRVFELNDEKFTVKVAPNPVSEDLNLSFESNEEFNAQIVISDLSGRQITSENVFILRGPNFLKIPMSNLYSGIYIVQMRQANRLLFTEKIVKNE